MSLASRSRKFINSSASKKGGEKLENVSPSPKQNKVDNVEAPKPTSVKSDKKQNNQANRENTNPKNRDENLNVKGDKRVKKDSKKDKNGRDYRDSLDEMINNNFGSRDIGSFRPENHSGILGIYFTLKAEYDYINQADSEVRNGAVGRLLKGKAGLFGKTALGLSNIYALAGNGIGLKEASFVDENSIIDNFKINKEEAQAIKNINIGTFARDMGLDDVMTPADMAEAIKNGNSRQEFEDMTLRAVNEVIQKKDFVTNMQNLEKSVESIGQAFNLSKDGKLDDKVLEQQSVLIKNSIADFEKFTQEQKAVFGSAINSFHYDIAQKGELNFKKFADDLKDKFSQSEIDKIIGIIDEKRKSEVGYVAHNVNVYASLAEKRSEVENVKKLLGDDFSKQVLNSDDLKNFVKENSYAGLMAVVKNMPVDDDMDTKLRISDLLKDKGAYEYQKIESLQVDNQANRLATILEINEILDKGKVDFVKKLDNQEQLSLEKLQQDRLEVNPFDMATRGNMSVYFRNGQGELVANQAMTIASIAEGKSNLGNILNFNVNHDSSLVILDALNKEKLLQVKGGASLNNGENLNDTIQRSIREFKADNLQILKNIKENSDNEAFFKKINNGATSDLKNFKTSIFENPDPFSNENEKKRISEVVDLTNTLKNTFHDRRDVLDKKFSSSEDLALSAKMHIEPQVIGTDKEAVAQAKNTYEQMANQQNVQQEIKTDNTNLQQEQERLQREQREQQERIRLEEEARKKEQEKEERWEKIKTYGWIALNIATCFTPAGAVFKGIQLVAKGIQIARTAKFAENAVALTKGAEIVEKGLHVVNNSKITNNIVTRELSDMAILNKVDDALAPKMN